MQKSYAHFSCDQFTSSFNKDRSLSWSLNFQWNDKSAEPEKVLNVPSMVRVTVMMFLNVDHLGGDIFKLRKGASITRFVSLSVEKLNDLNDLIDRKYQN